MRRIFVLSLLLAALLAPGFAGADQREVQLGHQAVRAFILSRVNPNYRVNFITSVESNVTEDNQEIISGRGTYGVGANWRDSNPFDYSVRVRNSRETSDIKVTLADGKQLGSGTRWLSTEGAADGSVMLTRPGWFDRVSSSNVEFAGTATGEVTISVFTDQNKKVAEERVRPQSGRFQTFIYLPQGLYRAVIQPTLSFDYDEVRFSVNTTTTDWGIPNVLGNRGVENRISVSSPARDSNLQGPMVSISGQAVVPTVRVQIFDDADRRVYDKSLTVRNGQWNTDTRLADGKYRLLVDSTDQLDKDSVYFAVGGTGNTTHGVESRITVLAPTRDLTIRGSTVAISGRAVVPTVRVQIFDESDQRIFNKSVVVKDGLWSTEASLANGSYRMLVDSTDQLDKDSVKFSVTGSGSFNRSIESRISISSPKLNERIETSPVKFEGTSVTPTIRVQIFDEANKRVWDKSVAVSDGLWSTQADLPNGSYRMLVDAKNEKDKDARTFTVGKLNSLGRVRVGSENMIIVDTPKRDEIVKGPQFDISGTSKLDTIRVAIYDEADKRIFNKSLTVKNGAWSVQTSLPSGIYRIVVDTHGKEDTDAFWFTVKSGN